MKRIPHDFTCLELVVALVLLVFLAFIFFGYIDEVTRVRPRAQLIQCQNNLKQIGIAIFQYEKTYPSAPAYSAASATATADGNLCAANLMRIYSCGLVDDLERFHCPRGAFAPAWTNANASPATVRDDPDGAKYTAYNLTTCHDVSDPANKIIVADMPYALGNVTASAHDAKADQIDVGPNCLFQDGRVKNMESLCPEDSSEHDLSPHGNIYRVDGGEGKGKDTCILGVAR